MSACELCTPRDVVLENDLAYARYEGNSLSRGHVIVVPKRHVADFFEMDGAEQAAVLQLLNGVRQFIQKNIRPTATTSAPTSARPRGSRACTSTCISSRATKATYRIRAAESAAS